MLASRIVARLAAPALALAVGACSSSSSPGGTSTSNTSGSGASTSGSVETNCRCCGYCGPPESSNKLTGSQSSGASTTDTPSATGTTSTTGTASTTGATSTHSGATGSQVCNDLTASGPAVPFVCASGSAPTLTGGTIVDGTYTLASFSAYGGVCAGVAPDASVGISAESTLVISDNGTAAQLVSSTGGAGVTGTATFAPVGNELSGDVTCGSGSEFTNATYSATPTSLTLEAPVNSSLAVLVFDRM